jgi:hypothetical protein
LCATNRRPQFSSTKNHNVQDRFDRRVSASFDVASGVGVGGFIGPASDTVKRFFEKKSKKPKKVSRSLFGRRPD